MYPFERFTTEAQHVLTVAQQEAADRHHAYIGTEHLALALCKQTEGIAGRVLAEIGVTEEALRTEIGHQLEHVDEQEPLRVIPTSRVKKIIELAFGEATAAGSDLVASEHLLLAVLVEAEGVGAHALNALGATLSVVRARIHAAMAERSADQTTPPVVEVGTSSSLALALMQAGQLAQEEGAVDIRPDHLLRAMAMSPSAELQGVLRRAGVSVDAVAGALTVPEEIRRMGREARDARSAGGSVYSSDAPEAAATLGRMENLGRRYHEALSRWLAGDGPAVQTT